ncbi:tRNA preQ1(34) S-adenosylmethionine ribosyltransferase-isomerase QueA [bacterium]|nr:tRNA preQ1(34) S-adenosylmethionine ribosyltransferase-isomerase QueA [bacterium]|tara:strand:- start:4802 stop:5821 length:1020 start_codon:yes stop_codon:yes gene_type:complete
MKLSEFDYFLPPHLIAQSPTINRDHSRLMVVDTKNNRIFHHSFHNIIDYLNSNTVLILNDTKVFNARLYGYKNTGALIEMFLLKQIDKTTWSCLLRPAKRLSVGDSIDIHDNFYATVIEKKDTMLLHFTFSGNFFELLDRHGEPPLPPYIKPSNPNAFKQRYQTVYAKQAGSVAAPTAGLHFSESLLNTIRSKGVSIEYITLHVGYGTFNPVSCDNIHDHPMHSESYVITSDTSHRLQSYLKQGKTFVTVGTTSTRTIESAIAHSPPFSPGHFDSNLFIYPGYTFNCVDRIVTNFHLPKSTLLMLVSAYAGLPLIKRAYEEAIAEEYRFYSFGDAMLLI